MKVRDKQTVLDEEIQRLDQMHAQKKATLAQHLNPQFTCHVCGKGHDRILQLIDPASERALNYGVEFNICADCILQAAATLGITL